MTVEVEALEPFKILYNLPEDTSLVICIGGRGGAKTYEVSKFVAFSATIKQKRCVILRDEKTTIKNSIYNEIGLRYDTANASGILDTFYEKNDSGLKQKTTDKFLIFTHGFRASSNEKTANMKGISDIDIAVVEEAEDIRDKNKYDTFSDSIRKKGYLIIVILNTPDLEHWIIKRYFDIVEPDIIVDDPKKIDGYFKLIPKKIPGFVCIQTSYKDNKNKDTGISNLPQSKINDYEGYGQLGHHLYDWHHYMTDILGYASSGRKGQVYTKFKPITLEDYLKLPFKEHYGQDWGTSAPAAMIGVKFDGNNVYARELNYEPKNNLEIGKMYCQLGLTENDIIIADSAEPASIGLLRTGWQPSELTPDDLTNYPGLIKGFSIFAVANKNIEEGISVVKSHNVFICGANFWHEIANYIYGQNKSGEYTNTPIGMYDHLSDCLRYMVISKGRYF